MCASQLLNRKGLLSLLLCPSFWVGWVLIACALTSFTSVLYLCSSYFFYLCPRVFFILKGGFHRILPAYKACVVCLILVFSLFFISPFWGWNLMYSPILLCFKPMKQATNLVLSPSIIIIITAAYIGWVLSLLCALYIYYLIYSSNLMGRLLKEAKIQT